MVLDSLEEVLRNRDLHYLILRGHDDGAWSSEWFLDETCTPDMAKAEEGRMAPSLQRACTRGTMSTAEDEFDKYDKHSSAMNQGRARNIRSDPVVDNIDNKLCLGLVIMLVRILRAKR